MNERPALSEREMEILRLVATGATNHEIARQLVISVNTVKVHLRNIFEKLGVTSRTEATMVAVREGWVRVPGQQEPIPDEIDQAGAEDEALPAAALPSTFPVLPEVERWPQVSMGKRASLLLALAAAVMLLIFPSLLESRANGERRDPIRDVLPTKTTGLSVTRWHTRAQMPTPRTHLAVASVGNLIYAIGGVGGQGVVDRVEVYDPQADTWTSRRAKPTPVGFVSAAVLDDKIYVPGGIIGESKVSAVLEVYDPTHNTWQQGAQLPRALASYGLAAYDGRLYLFGGWDGQSYVASIYRYDPSVDRWEELPAMEQPRGLLGVAVLQNRIYLVGGYDGSAELNAVDSYEPASGNWTSLAPLSMRRSGLAVIAVRDFLYAIGGGGMAGYLAFNERYDPRLDVWSRFQTPVVDQWRGPGLAFSFPYIYAIGGSNGTTLSTNEAYQALYQLIIKP